MLQNCILQFQRNSAHLPITKCTTSSSSALVGLLARRKYLFNAVVLKRLLRGVVVNHQLGSALLATPEQ